MPIVTAAVIAVAAAVATTTVATVATAAVAVGTLVGTVGLGISVIGMATGNKTLSKIGGYLGMAGGAMGLAGGLAGGMAGYAKTLSTAWDDGVGSLFSSTKPIGQEALGRGIVAGANPQAAEAFKNAGQTVASQADLGRAIVANTPMPMSQATSPTILSNNLTEAQKSALITPEHVQLSKQANDIQRIANANPASMAAPNTGADALASTTHAAAKGGQFPSVGVDPGASGSGGSGALNMADSLKNFPSVGVGNITGGGERPDAKSLWASLPDWAKGQIAITGAQGLSGAIGGWFESATAEEKLELERQAQQWRMAHEDRNQAFQQKSASFAPHVQFGSGTLNRGA